MHARPGKVQASAILCLVILITAGTPATAALVCPGAFTIPVKTGPTESMMLSAVPANAAGTTCPVLKPGIALSMNNKSIGYDIPPVPGRVTPRDCIRAESKDLTPSANVPVVPGIQPVHSYPGLDEVTWHLTAYGMGDAPQKMLDGTIITLVFDRLTQKVTGTSGCNLIYAAYHAGKGRITISGLGSTRMYCPMPVGVMEQEQRFLGILGQVTGYSLSGHILTLSTDSGLVLVFSE